MPSSTVVNGSRTGVGDLLLRLVPLRSALHNDDFAMPGKLLILLFGTSIRFLR